MAEQSFHEMMVIDTPEKLENLKEAFRMAEIRGPLVIDDEDEIIEMFRRGEEYLRSHRF